MSNAYGGIVNLAILVVFLVIVSGFLAFSVAYNKAFRVKNKMISSIEVCEGIVDNDNDCAVKSIEDYMKSIGFNSDSSWKLDPTELKNGTCRNGYCWDKIEAPNASKENPKYYYKVATAVNIDLPVLSKILPQMKIFRVSGTTKNISVKK